MPKLLFCILLLLSTSARSQDNDKSDSLWKHELKVKSGLSDFDIHTDKDSYYFIEKRENTIGSAYSDGSRRSYFNISRTDKGFKELWWKEYFMSLAEFTVFDIRPVEKELVIFLSDYHGKAKTYTIEFARVNKEDGSIPKASHFTPIATYPRGERRADYVHTKMHPVKKGFILVSDISGKKNVSYGVTLLSPALNTLSSTILNIQSAPELYSVEDVKVSGGRILLLGKEYEESLTVAGKKSKVFKKYILSVYNMIGEYQGEIPVDIAGRITTARMVEAGDKVMFAGLYNTYTVREVPDGVITGTIDPFKKEITVHTDQKIAAGMFADSYRREIDSAELNKRLPLFSFKNRRKFVRSNSDIDIKSIDVHHTDNSFIIAAEIMQIDEYDEYVYGNRSLGLAGAALQSGEIIKIYHYKTKDLLLLRADSGGKITWVNVIPKNQQETFTYTKPVASSFSSYKAEYVNGRYRILYNDSKENTSPVDYNKVVKALTDFKKDGGLFSLSIDPRTGNTVKTVLTNSSNDNAVLIPTKSIIDNKTFVVPALELRPLAKDIFKIVMIE